MSQEAGATVTRETPIREFQTDRPAILDVTAFGTAEIVDLIIDVTVRHPTCAEYGRTDRETDRAATMAEGGKQQRYPPAGGRRVTTFAVETWGRLGSEAEQVLQQRAGAARRRDQQRDRLAMNRIPKWRALIDATNQRSIARRLLGAFLGTDGKPWRPPPYRRDCAYEANTNRLTAGEQMTYPHTGLDPARLQRWTYDARGTGQNDDGRGTTSTAAADQPPRTPHATTQIPFHPPAQTAVSPASSRQATSAASQSHLYANGRTPSQTPYGSELPQGLHAVNTHECRQPAGQVICNSTPCHNCVICLAGMPGEGPNVCARALADFATNRQPPAEFSHTLPHGQTRDCPTHARTAAPMGILSDGAVSACTGSRSRTSSPSTDSGLTTVRGIGSTLSRQTARRPRSLPPPRTPRYCRPACSSRAEPKGRTRARSRTPEATSGRHLGNSHERTDENTEAGTGVKNTTTRTTATQPQTAQAATKTQRDRSATPTADHQHDARALLRDDVGKEQAN